jgi:protoheme ferro-lyase
MLFTRVAPHTKNKGALDQCSTHLLLLSAHALPRTKSKEFHMYVLQIYYFINQVFKSFCSSAGIIIDGLALP